MSFFSQGELFEKGATEAPHEEMAGSFGAFCQGMLGLQLVAN